MCRVLVFTSIIIFSSLVPSFAQFSGESPYTLYKQGRLREAVDTSLVLIEQDSSNISAYAVAGLAYLGLKLWTKALEISKKGYTLAPNDLRLLATIGEAHYELNQDNEALKYLSRYLVLGKNGELKHWMYYYIANIYLRSEKLYKADIALSAALHYENTRPEWVLKLAALKEEKGEQTEAVELYKKVLDLDPGNRIARQKIQQIRLSN